MITNESSKRSIIILSLKTASQLMKVCQNKKGVASQKKDNRKMTSLAFF